MVFELLALQECNDAFRDPPCFDMTRLEFLDMTTNEIPFEFDADLNLPDSSAVKVDIGIVKISVYDGTYHHHYHQLSLFLFHSASCIISLKHES